MQIKIIVDVYEECADPNDDTGLTDAAFMDLHDAIAEVGSVVRIKALREGAG